MHILTTPALSKLVEGAAAYCRGHRLTDAEHHLSIVLAQVWRDHAASWEQSVIQAALPLLQKELQQ